MTITHLQSPIMVHRPRVFVSAPPPFSPADIPGLYASFMGDAGTYQDTGFTTPASADGHAVGGWQDQSGNGWHMTQPDAANQPLLKLGANGINGRAALLFDGSNDKIFTSAMITHGIGTGDFWWIVVCQRIGTGSGWDGLIANGIYVPCLYARATYDKPFPYWPGKPGGDFAGGLSTSSLIVEFGRVSGAAKLVVNGTQDANTFDWSAADMQNGYLTVGAAGPGSVECLNVKIGEVLCYKPAPSDANLALLRTYLNGRWAVY